MSAAEEIAASIDVRIEALKAEMEALESARAQLVKGPQAAPATPRRPRGRPRRGAATKTPAPGAPPASAPEKPAAPEPEATPGPPAELTAELIETMLGEHADGLSALAIAKRAGVTPDRALAMLHDLEKTGRVHSGGERRTSLWRLVSEEEWIAHRTAELERRASGQAAPAAQPDTDEADESADTAFASPAAQAE